MSEDSKTLWCIQIVGPDDWYAAKSLTHAREMAGKINAQICRSGHDDENEPNVWAVPGIWPWSAEQHAQSLKELDSGQAKHTEKAG
jgi:hypothetical protein